MKRFKEKLLCSKDVKKELRNKTAISGPGSGTSSPTINDESRSQTTVQSSTSINKIRLGEQVVSDRYLDEKKLKAFLAQEFGATGATFRVCLVLSQNSK